MISRQGTRWLDSCSKTSFGERCSLRQVIRHDVFCPAFVPDSSDRGISLLRPGIFQLPVWIATKYKKGMSDQRDRGEVGAKLWRLSVPTFVSALIFMSGIAALCRQSDTRRSQNYLESGNSRWHSESHYDFRQRQEFSLQRCR